MRCRPKKGPKMTLVIEFVLFVGFICACWFVIFLSTFVHEFGHAAAYMIKTGDTHWHIRIGCGKSILKTQRLSINLAPFDGYCMIDDKIKSKPDLIFFLLGGPLFSFLTLVILLGIRLKFGVFESEIIAPGAIVAISNLSLFSNALILILSLAPIHYFWGENKGMKSDGLKILHIMKSKRSWSRDRSERRATTCSARRQLPSPECQCHQ